MDKFATIIINNKNKAAAQTLLSERHFKSELKKGLRSFWMSSGFFTKENYDLIADSGLALHIKTDPQVSALETIKHLKMKQVIIVD